MCQVQSHSIWISETLIFCIHFLTLLSQHDIFFASEGHVSCNRKMFISDVYVLNTKHHWIKFNKKRKSKRDPVEQRLLLLNASRHWLLWNLEVAGAHHWWSHYLKKKKNIYINYMLHVLVLLVFCTYPVDWFGVRCY